MIKWKTGEYYMKINIEKCVLMVGVSVIYILFYFVMLALGCLTYSYMPDIAVDSKDNLYLGKTFEIYVFQEGKNIDHIHVSDNIGKYFFYIKDDLLYVSKGTSVDILDLSGNTLNVLTNTSLSDLFEDYNTKTADYTSQNGSKYYSYSLCGRYYVMRVSSNGEKTIIFKMSFKDYILKIFLMVAILIMIIGIFGILADSMKDVPKSKRNFMLN